MDRAHGFAAVGIVAAMSLLGGCGGENTDSPAAAGNGACDVVLDVTGHPSADWSFQELSKSVKSGALQQTCADRLMLAGLITDYSKANACPTPSVNTYFRDPNQKKQKRLQDEAWLTYTQEVNDLFVCGVYGDAAADPGSARALKFEGSDVFSAVQEAQQSMSAVEGPKSLILFSDMRNTMPPMTVPNREPVDQAVAQLQEKGVVPDLQGTDVVVVGSGTSDAISPVRQAKIVDFWTAFFQAAGANVQFQESL